MARRVYPKSASDPNAKVQLSGPFFEPDAGQRLRQNMRAMVQAVAEEGDRVVTARSPELTGDFKAGIVVKTRGRNAWLLSASIQATHVYPWGEHVGATISRRELSGKDAGKRDHRRGANRKEAQYLGGKLEAKYGMFRNVTRQLRVSRAQLAANLTQGLE